MKIFKAINILILTIVLAINCCATNTVGGEIVYEEENISVIFSADTQYTIDEQKVIADQLVNGCCDDGIVPCNILCDIFGHDFSTEYIQIIQHKVNTLSPRCLKKTYEANGCSRCDYFEYELFSQAYIECCPQE